LRARAIATPDRRSELSLTMSVFHVKLPIRTCFVRLAAGDAAASPDAAPESAVFEAIEGAVTGFLSPIPSCGVQYANPAFAQMIEVASPEDTRANRSPAGWN